MCQDNLHVHAEVFHESTACPRDGTRFLPLAAGLVDTFLRSFDRPTGHLTLDLDPVDDPAHGQQHLTMFHAYYDENQYLPIVITCAEDDLVLLVGLRHGTCEPSLGVDTDLRYLVGRLRAAWPDVHIHVRGDSGLGVPRMYDVCHTLSLPPFAVTLSPLDAAKTGIRIGDGHAGQAPRLDG